MEEEVGRTYEPEDGVVCREILSSGHGMANEFMDSE